MSAAPTLRPYQVDCLNAIANARELGTNRVLVKKPTGTGKTVTFAAMPEWPPLKAWLSQFTRKDRKMLVIAHREELLDQAAEKIARANPHLGISIEQGSRYASSLSDVVVASIQTLAASKFRRLERLMTRHNFRLVIVDEAHHASATTYRGVLSRLGFLPPVTSERDDVEAATADEIQQAEITLPEWDKISPKDRLLVGVTATPNRADSVGLGIVFQTIAYNYDLKQAIRDGWLVPIVPWVIESRTSLDEVKVNRGEFVQSELSDAVNTPERNRLAVAAYHEYARGRQAIAFTVDVQHAIDAGTEFEASGLRVAVVSGKTPKEERRAIMRDIRNGQIDVVTNCAVLTEGTDLPTVSCIVHMKPTKSATLYEQMTGRALRLSPGKKTAVILDIVDIARRHSLQTVPMLYGLPPILKVQGRALDEVEAEWEEFHAKYPNLTMEGMKPMTLEDMKAIATTFDIWQLPDMGEYASDLTMKWMRPSDQSFRLQYPWQDTTEVVTVSPDMVGKWEVKLTTLAHQVGQKAAALVRTIASGFADAKAALAVAENYVFNERSAVRRLKASGAPWRNKPATEKQIAALVRMRAPYRKGMTAGEASDLMDISKARRGR